MGTCYSWETPSLPTQYDVTFTPPGGSSTTVEMQFLTHSYNGNVYLWVLCSETYPIFIDRNTTEPVPDPYPVTVGGACTTDSNCMIPEADPDPDPDPVPDPIPDGEYGPKHILEYENRLGETLRTEIWLRGYEGEPEFVDGGPDPFILNRENYENVFETFRGSNAVISLISQESRKFFPLFTGDERTWKIIHKVDGVPWWSGWITPDLFEERYMPGPYQTSVKAIDGIGGLKDLSFPDILQSNYQGEVSELDVILACLRRTDLNLVVQTGVNLRENSMGSGNPLALSKVNCQAFTEIKDGERLPMSCYNVLTKILKSWNACLWQERNMWRIVRIPELFKEWIYIYAYDSAGENLSEFSFNIRKNFQNIKLHNALLMTTKAVKNITVAMNFGDLYVEENNFILNGDFEEWHTNFPGTNFAIHRLLNWTYSNLEPWVRTGSSSWNGNVRRVEETSPPNNYINIYGWQSDFNVNNPYLESKPQPIRMEEGNVINVRFQVRCNTEGSNKSLFEAYFIVAVRAGSKWLGIDNGEYVWMDDPTLVTWRIASVMTWEDVAIENLPVPEDGDVSIRLYQIRQVHGHSTTRYVVDYDNVRLELSQNPALVFGKTFYKSSVPETFTQSINDIEIELGDSKTVMSQNAKIVNNDVTKSWARAGKTESQPLARIIARDYLNQFQSTTYRLSGGSMIGDLLLLSNYQDLANEPDRYFIVGGGRYSAKHHRWNPEFIEINQIETTTPIREVSEARKDTSVGVDGQSNKGSSDVSSPVPPSGIELDDGVIPQVEGTSLVPSGMTVGGGVITSALRIKGPEAVEADDYVVLSQLESFLTEDEIQAIKNADLPSGSNPFATQGWVEAQNYLVPSDLSGYAEIGTGPGQVRSNADLDVRFILTSAKGAVNGVAELDSNGKVPLSQINDALLGNVNYQGQWNASTNTPTLPDPTTVKGHYYITQTAGTFNSIFFEIGDWVISNGVTWDRVANTDAVATVFGRTGNVIAQGADYTSFYVRHDAPQSLPSGQQAQARTNIGAGDAVIGTGGTQVRTNTQLDARYVLKSGDTMTGSLNIESISHAASQTPSGLTVRSRETNGFYSHFHLGTTSGGVPFTLISQPGGAGSYISFQVGSGEVVRFRQDGNVGIGTSTPSSLLDVAGTVVANQVSLNNPATATAHAVRADRTLTIGAASAKNLTSNQSWTLSEIGAAEIGTGGTQVRTNTQLDARYVLKSGDTMTGRLTANMLGEAIRIQSTGAGQSGTGWISFTDSGAVRQGYVGRGTVSDSDIYLSSDVGNTVLRSSTGNIIFQTGGSTTRATVSNSGIDIAGTVIANAFQSESFLVTLSSSGTWVNVTTLPQNARKIAWVSSSPVDSDVVGHCLMSLYQSYDGSTAQFTAGIISSSNLQTQISGNTLQARSTLSATANKQIRVSIFYLINQ